MKIMPTRIQWETPRASDADPWGRTYALITLTPDGSITVDAYGTLPMADFGRTEDAVDSATEAQKAGAIPIPASVALEIARDDDE